MRIAQAALLAGPRGRRLCLELALALAHESAASVAEGFTGAAFYAAYDADPGRGTSRVMFGPGSRGAVPRPSPADVARLLDDAGLTAPDAGSLLRALAAAVDNARYRQEPDGAAPAVPGQTWTRDDDWRRA